MNTRQIKELKEQKEDLIKEQEKLEEQLEKVSSEYSSFFSCSGNKDFKLYKKLPSIEKFKTYMEYGYHPYQRNDEKPVHPLDNNNYSYHNNGRFYYSYSYFNLEELAILLKMIYNYQTGKESGIITTGSVVSIPGLINAYPEIHYLVGSKAELEKYEENQGIMYEQEDKFNFDKSKPGIIVLHQTAFERNFYNEKREIEFSEVDERKVSRTVDFYDYKTVCGDAKGYFRKYENIFRNHIGYHLDEIRTHRDLFDINIAKEDNFISNILYSIMIYKKRNDKIDLTEEDYKKIMNSLFGKNIPSIQDQIDSEIPKEFEYVESPETREKYIKTYEYNKHHKGGMID